MTTKEEKLYTFYKQCLEKNYTDMSDETQALKAKVFAMDLNLRYSNISALYKEASEVYNVVEERNRIDKEKADELAAKLAVPGEIILTITGNVKEQNATVYRRPDGSVYSIYNSKKIEGIPSFSVEKGGVLKYTYHPSKTVFTGASSGGIAMGGFHETKAYTTESVSETGKGSVVMQMDDQRITLDYVSIADEIVNKYKRDSLFNTLCRNNGITCYSESNTSMANDIVHMTMQRRQSTGESFEKTMSDLSLAADLRKLPYSTCCTIARYLGAITNGNYPESDEVLYDRAVDYSKSEKSDYLKKSYELFDLISDYKDSKDKGQKIKEKYEEVLQKEKEQKVIEKERTEKKRNIIIIIIAVIAIIGLVIFLVVNNVIIPSEKYKKAIALKNEGNYKEAINAFGGLNHYKDSTDQIIDCNYLEAISLKNSGHYEDAIITFEKLNGYKDSAEQIDFCKDEIYNSAIALKDAGHYDEAITVFKKLYGYKDSVEQINNYENSLMLFPKKIEYIDGRAREYEYDSVGNVIKYIQTRDDGSKKIYNYEYSDGKLKSITYNLHTFSFLDNGASSKETIEGEDSTAVFINHYIYDDNGMIKEIVTEKGPDQEIAFKDAKTAFSYEYNDKGFITAVDRTIVRHYDNENPFIAEQTSDFHALFNYDNGVLSSVKFYDTTWDVVETEPIHVQGAKNYNYFIQLFTWEY